MRETNYRIHAGGEEKFWKAARGMWDMLDLNGVMPWEGGDSDGEYKYYETSKFSWFVSGNIGVGGREWPLQNIKGDTALSPHFSVSSTS